MTPNARTLSTNRRLRTWIAAVVGTAIFLPIQLCAQPVAVRQLEGQLHGFLVLRTLGGAIVANGELTQASHGNEMTVRMVYHFKDGSLQDETTVFSQSGHFKLISDHLIQKGPVFKHPMDVAINAASGDVTVRYQDDHGKEKVDAAHLDLEPDLANGMVPTLLKNVAPGTQKLTASMVVATPKPMLVKLDISDDGEDAFSTGSAGHKAKRYDVKIDIGGIKGVVAGVIGKQPPDTFVWILGGEYPAFVRAEGPSFESGPVWRTELVSPTWPRNPQSADRKK
jgi:hypothetical protein